MIKFGYALGFLTLSLVLVACPRMNVKLTDTNTTQDMPIQKKFKGIWASNGVVVTLSQADQTKLTMTTDEGYVDLVQVLVNQDGVLKLSRNLKASSVVADVRFELATNLNTLESLKTSFTSQMTAPDLNVNSLNLKSGGNSTLKLGNITAEKLTIDTGGQSNLRIADTIAPTVNINTGGESNLVIANLQAQTAIVDSGGDSQIKITGTCTADKLTYDQGGESQFIRTGC